jgi:UDP-2,3-diacylglucosamine pyrophosphatase LpxH
VLKCIDLETGRVSSEMNKDWVRLIISDTHLGSAHAKEGRLLALLSELVFDELILAGDIVEFLRKPVFTATTLEIIKLINTKPKKVIYIIGNHDDALFGFVNGKIANVEFVRQYNFEYGNRKFRIEHGDQYETGIVRWRYTIELVSFFQNMLERVFNIDLTTWWSNRQLKKRKLRRIWDIAKWNDEADVFIMGHTHSPEVLIWLDKTEKIKTYINSGDWIENCTYVICKDSQVRLRKYEPFSLDDDTETAEFYL